MFWFGKKKKKKKNKKQTKKSSREEIMAHAMANARKAREEMGEETIQRIAAAIQKKENSEMERAKTKLKAMDQDILADNIRFMMHEE